MTSFNLGYEIVKEHYFMLLLQFKAITLKFLPNIPEYTVHCGVGHNILLFLNLIQKKKN